MSKILQEVVVEAKKLREYAIAEAKASVMESLTPTIKEMAEKEINKVLESPLFEEVLDEVDAALAATSDPSNQTPVDPAQVTDPAVTATPDTQTPPAEAAPAEPKTIELTEPTLIVPAAGASTATPEAPMPPAETPVEPPAPAPTDANAAPLTETEVEEDEEKMSLDEETYEIFKESVSYVERVSESKYVNKQMLKPRLVKLFVMLENNKNKWNLPKSVFALAENRINVIFEEIEKAQNSYNEIKGNNMKTIREFTQSLFTESKEGFGDGGKAKEAIRSDSEVDRAASKSAEHAKSLGKPVVSGKLETLGGTALKGTGKAQGGPQEDGEPLNESEEMDEAEKALMEMLDAELSGDEDKTGEEDVVKEGNVEETVSAEQVVAEAKQIQRNLLKEKIKRALKECMMGDSAHEEMGDKEEELDASVVSKDLDDDGDMDELVVNVNMPDEEEGSFEMASDDEDDKDSELDMNAKRKGDDTVLEVVDDMNEMDDLKEADQLMSENRVLRSRLNESDLLTARSIYLNKILTEHNLSTRQKQAVVRHLDKSHNLAEAKEFYFRINSLLRERTKVVASPSAATKPAQSPINESTNNRKGLSVGSVERWQQLAGIKK